MSTAGVDEDMMVVFVSRTGLSSSRRTLLHNQFSSDNERGRFLQLLSGSRRVRLSVECRLATHLAA